MRSGGEFLTYYAKYDIGASGAHTKATNNPGIGFGTVSRTAAGKFTVNFAPGLGVGDLVDFRITVWKATDTEGPVPRPTDGSFIAPTASAAGSVKWELWDIDETAAQVDPASGDTISYCAVFSKTA